MTTRKYMNPDLHGGGKDVARDIKLKVFKGASAMFVRQMFIMVINFVASIILARRLSPADFGIYVISSFVINTLILFTDVGLGAALIQRKEEPELRQYRTIFTFQLSLIVFVVSMIFFLSPVIVKIYKVDEGVKWFLRAMSLILLIASIGSVSVIKLERQLAYSAFARIDIAAVVVDKGVAVFLAWMGYGYWSFLAAGLCSALVRVAATYLAAPWSIGFCLDKSFLKSTIKFGGMFQLAGMTALFRDNMNSLLVGPTFGPKPVGYLNWSHNIALQGSQVFTQIVSRVNFPSLSRVQDDPAVLTDIVNRTLRLLNVMTIPILLIMAALIHEIVTIIYTSKWNEAIPAFYCYVALMIGGNITTTLSGFLLATDAAKVNLIIMTVWTVLVWLFGLIFIKYMGFTGVALATVFAIIIISIILIVVVNKRISIDLVGALAKPMFAGLVIGMLVYWIRSIFQVNLFTLVLLAISALFFSVVLNLFIDKGLRNDFSLMLKNIKTT